MLKSKRVIRSPKWVPRLFLSTCAKLSWLINAAKSYKTKLNERPLNGNDWTGDNQDTYRIPSSNLSFKIVLPCVWEGGWAWLMNFAHILINCHLYNGNWCPDMYQIYLGNALIIIFLMKEWSGYSLFKLNIDIVEVFMASEPFKDETTVMLNYLMLGMTLYNIGSLFFQRFPSKFFVINH